MADATTIAAVSAAKRRADELHEEARRALELAWAEVTRTSAVAWGHHKAWLAVMAAPELPADDYDGCAL
jgi:hypothetical protein